jgi:SAM-dependent methyltransferase
VVGLNNNTLYEYLIQEESQPLHGWDFSHLKGRMSSDPVPWDYEALVRSYLRKDTTLLDMGTGGGEFLLTLGHPHALTSVTESYPPNVELCQNRLGPLGITVYAIPDDALADVPTKAFDVVINRHESYDERAVHRILKDGGYFITQQVGARNNRDLALVFEPESSPPYPEMTRDICVTRLQEQGFLIHQQHEAFPRSRFFDLGALVYFAKALPWEFPEFSVDRHWDTLRTLEEKRRDRGWITSTEHRILIVAQKPMEDGKSE